MLSQEQGGLNCRYIDIEAENGAEKIIAELYNKTPRYYTAYRNGCRYTEVLKDVDISALEHSRLGVKSEGVYIIAGVITSYSIHYTKLYEDLILYRSSWDRNSTWGSY